MQKPFHLIDLTHVLSPETPTWSGGCGFDHVIHTDYADHLFRTHKIKMHEGIGTHMDAPAHCIPGGKCIDELDINTLLSPCAMIDVSSGADASYSLSPEDIIGFETQHGPLLEGTFVLVSTGWERFWNTPAQYRNDLAFPSVSKAAAELLLERNISGLGIDTLSTDCPDSGFPVHQLLLGAGKIIVENVANSLALPPTGAYILPLPLKVQGGTEAPLRLVGVQFPPRER